MYNYEGKFVEQLNFKSYPPVIPVKFLPPYVDLNRDGVSELLIFSLHEDTLFLNAMDYTNWR